MAVRPLNTIFIDVGDVFVGQNRKSLEMQTEEAPSFLKHSLMDCSGRHSEDQNAARKADSRTAPTVRGN